MHALVRVPKKLSLWCVSGDIQALLCVPLKLDALVRIRGHTGSAVCPP